MNDEVQRRHEDAMKRGYRAGLVYVYLYDGENGEYGWARPITETTCKILFVPCFTNLDVNYGDYVEHDGGTADKEPEFIRVLERNPARTVLGKYVADTPEDWQSLSHYLDGHDIVPGGAGDGIVAMSVPDDVDDDALRTIAASSPVPLELWDG